MHVVVVGCGLAGLTTAWFLRERDVDVTVIDRADAPARETSYANGSMITPSLADPWNAPGVLGALLNSLGKEDSAMLLRLKALPSLIGWGLRFLANATRPRFEASYLANVRFAHYSQRVMSDLLQANPMEFSYAPDGTIKVYADGAAFEAGRQTAKWLEAEGVTHRALARDELLQAEPALSAVIERFHGGLHFVNDEVGNARTFCEQLAALAADAGVEFRFGCTLTGVEKHNGQISMLITDQGAIPVDAVVLAAGPHSWPVGKLFGVRVPVRPAKGYSITVPVANANPFPKYPIVDDALHAAVVPLGGTHLRVAGTAEFAGFDARLSEGRIDNLKRLLGQVYPQIEYEDAEVEGWCGFRPMTPDGKPIIGATRIPNLYLNTGHGPLGWTLGCGSGEALANLITNSEQEYDLAEFSPSRF